MDYSRLDLVRRKATPLELDLVESYASGKITRRQFMKRAAVIGLSGSAVAMVVAACSQGAPSSAAPSASGGASPSAGGSASAAPSGGNIRIAQQRAVKIDPVLMQDLSGYGIVSQSFEYLATLNKDGDDIDFGLATEYKPNGDGSVWTFKLREGATWMADGSPFTADDVVATMARLVKAGNAGLKGVIDENSAKAVDPQTVEFSLLSPNGNFPYLVSVFNPQSVITPKDYETGTTLDAKPNGTGAWKMESYNPATGATFSRNPTWWGGTTPLDSLEFVFFDATGPQVTAYQGGQVDAINQFDVLSGDALFADEANTTIIAIRAATHRQIWMRVDEGQFTKKEVRQALALSLDRDALIQQLFKGRADLGNDHVIAPIYPYYDDSVPQRTRDIEKAKSLLGGQTINATLHAGQLLEIPDLAALMKSQAAEAGFNLEVAVENLDTFYGAQWCPEQPADPPCSGAAELGIVDYGHRATPDVYLNAALKSKGIWNSSQYASADFDAAFGEFQAAIGVDAQKAACKKIETILNDEVPIVLPYWYNFLGASSKAFTGIYTSALGQMFLSSASKVA